jgi:hypothetical protein
VSLEIPETVEAMDAHRVDRAVHDHLIDNYRGLMLQAAQV